METILVSIKLHTGEIKILGLVLHFDCLCRPNHNPPILSSGPQPLKSTARTLSSHLHPHNLIKCLHLRDTPFIVRPEVVDPKFEKDKLCATV